MNITPWTTLVFPLLFTLLALSPCLAVVSQNEQDRGVTSRLPSPEILGQKKRSYKPEELLVKFKSGVTKSRKNSLHTRHGSAVLKDFTSLRVHHVRLKKGMGVEEAIELYKGDPDIEYAEPNYQYEALLTPNDPNYSQLWGMIKINAPTAWGVTTGNSSIAVAVIDTGIDYSHTDLATNSWTNPGEIAGDSLDNDGNGYLNDIHGINTANHDADPMDDHGHGTHVAGTIGAVGNNGIGVAGVNWNVKIIACKFLDAGGYGYTDGAIECLNYIKTLKERGVNIVATNNSWGGGGYSQALFEAINAQQDILFIAAAGNESSNNDGSSFYPAGYNLPNVLSVAATDSNDNLAYFSNFGPKSVHLGAPGNSIYSTLPAQNTWSISGSYGTLSGTSMATPHVTGLAALIKAQDMNRGWKEIKNLLLTGGDSIPSLDGKTITGKRTNANGSLSCTNSPLFAIKDFPSSITLGVPTTVTALSINCALPAGPVTVTTGLGETITLHDDGLAPDLVAGDGIFSGSWTPSREVELLTFTSPDYSQAVEVPSLSITTSVLPEASVFGHYSFFLTAAGGKPSYNWTISSGSLPSGLSLDNLTGGISGDTTAKGKYTVTFKATDSYGFYTEKSFTLYVSDDFLMQSWSSSYGTVGILDNAKGVTVDDAGNVYVAGYSGNPGNQRLVLKFDPSGNLLWNRSYSGATANGIAVDKTHNVYVTGSDYVTSKYDGMGNLLWTRTYTSGWAWSIAVDADSNVYVAGYAGYSLGGRNFQVVKYDTSGNLLWARAYDKGADELAYGVAVDTGGNVYLTGIEFSSWPDSSALTVKYAPSGTLLWSKSYKATRTDWGRSIAVDVAGNAFITGDSGDGGLNTNYLAIKYDASGNLLWSKPYPIYNAHGSSIVVDPSGNSYISGDDAGSPINRDCSIIKHDSSGNLVWVKRFDSGSVDFCNSIMVDGSRNLYLAGQLNPTPSDVNSYDFLLVKFKELNSYLLGYTSAGTGSGNADFSPGTTCSGACTQYYLPGTHVTLSVTPDSNSAFSGWSGACNGTPPCIVTMDADKLITATFTQRPPVAAFSSSIIAGVAPLAVTFTDLSTSNPTSWNWDFGDSSTSTQQNPAHTYNTAGAYTVSLLVTNASGSASTTKTNLISVSCPGPAPVQPVYDTALNSDTIRLRAGDLDENVDLYRDIAVTIAGGYDCIYLTSGGTTTIHGSVTIRSGSATLADLAIQ